MPSPTPSARSSDRTNATARKPMPTRHRGRTHGERRDHDDAERVRRRDRSRRALPVYQARLRNASAEAARQRQPGECLTTVACRGRRRRPTPRLPADSTSVIVSMTLRYSSISTSLGRPLRRRSGASCRKPASRAERRHDQRRARRRRPRQSSALGPAGRRGAWPDSSAATAVIRLSLLWRRARAWAT